MKLRNIALRNIRRNSRRSILSMTAVGVAAMAFVFMFGLIEGMKQDMAYNIQTFMSGEVMIRHSEFQKYEHLNPLHLGLDEYEQIITALEEKDAVESLSPRIRFPTAIYKEGNTYPAQGMGIDFDREIEFQNLNNYLVEGSMPQNGRNEALIASGLAKDMGLEIGDQFTILTQTRGRGMNAISLTITGITHYDMQGMNSKFFQAPLDRIQYLLRMDSSVSQILVKLKEGVDEEAFADEVGSSLLIGERSELEARAWTQINTTYGMIKLAETAYFIIALLFFFLGSTVIINTMMMIIFERRKEIGTISAMGMTGPEVVRLFFLEAFFIAVIGTFVGVLVGIGITYPLSIYGLDMTAAMEGVDMEISGIVKPVLNFRSTVFVFIYSTTVASLASLIPSRKSAKVNPVEALRAI